MPHRIQRRRNIRRIYVREWREFRGLNQDQLADRLEMSKASLSRLENGRQPYSQQFLEACADALLTDVPSLIMRNPQAPEAIWSLWDQAKPGQRRQIERAAEKIVKTGS